MQTFVCPDCHCVHAEPAEAFYVLSVRCSDCDFTLRYHEELSVEAVVAAVAVVAEAA